MSFVHLHVHSQYSLLDGFSNIKKLIDRTQALGMPAVALTDHGTMYGVIDFFNAARAKGIKPIIGIEAYMASRGMKDRDAKLDKQSHHLLLLAENQTGYQNLLKIASAAQTEGFYYHPRIDHDFLKDHAEGLIATSGCMSAEIPRTLRQRGVEQALPLLDWYYDVFGPDNFYLELQDHEIPELKQINRDLLQLGKRYNAKYVATNDVHYIQQTDARLQDILLCIQTGALITDPNRFRMSVDSFYLRSPEEMAKLFAEVPDALSNTLEIADRCNVDLSSKGYHLPRFSVPEGYTVESYLREMCEEGLRRRYGEARVHDPVLRERLEYELGIIHQMGFDAYFLIVWDLCRFSREEGIWYNARGSAAGSMVAYTLDITLVEPVHYGLIFERFLNPGRISMPDIDLDFQDDLRPKMMEYCARKYGDDRVAQIITFGTLGAKAAIRDVGRVMDIPLSEVDRVAKLIPGIPGKSVSITEALEQVPDLKKLYDEHDYLKNLIDTAAQMEGALRNAGTHAAGVVITDEPVVEYVPLNRPTSGSEDSPIKTVTQFEMSIIESLGLLKVDFLGLRTLTIMARACELIKQRHGIELGLHNIPIDDTATFEFLGKGHTAGVFQLEGSGMTRYVVQMQPKNVDNLIAMVALYRPGPLEFIPTYIRRMHGEESVKYLHPSLEPIFQETFGIPVYQEQIMRAAVDLAGYTMSESDELRKAISKKQKDKIEKHKEKFIKGAVARGIMDKATAASIFADWEEFARYGFNKSHAADYGVISVQTAYLKTHYTVEYMTALLSAEKNDTARVALYVADCRNMGIKVLPPDANHSLWDFSIEDCAQDCDDKPKAAIRFGLGAIKNVGQGQVDLLLEARREHVLGSLNEFVRQVDLRSLGKRALESLIKVGAMEPFGARRALLDSIDQILAISASHFKAAQSGQFSLFGAFADAVDDINLPQVFMSNQREELEWERELLGLYVSDHPLSPYLNALRQKITHFSGQLGEAQDKEKVTVSGMVTRFRNHQTKSGKEMGFVTIEDIQGPCELVIFPRTWERFGKLVEPDAVLIADGHIDAAGGDPKVLVDRLQVVALDELDLDSEDPASGSLAFGASFSMADPIMPIADEDQDDSPIQAAVVVPPQETPLPSKAAIIDGPEDPWADEPFFDDWHLHEAPRDEWIKPASRVILTVPDPLEAEGEVSTELSEDSSTRALPDEPELPGNNPFETPLFDLPPVVPANLPLDMPAQRTELPGNKHDLYIQPALFMGLPYLLPRSIYSETEAAKQSPRMVCVILRAAGSRQQDMRRVKRIHGILRSYPGKDKFSLMVFEHGRRYLLEFPNDTTGISSELLRTLIDAVGEGNVSVEPIQIL